MTMKAAASLILLTLAVMVVATIAGCGGSLYTTTYASLTLAEKVNGAATEQFPALDRYKRAQIVQAAKSEPEGIAALSVWDVTVAKIKKTIDGTDAAVKLVRDAMVEIKAGKRPEAELSTWIASAIRLGIDLKDLLAASGVALKGL